jgi:hypothetical protein
MRILFPDRNLQVTAKCLSDHEYCSMIYIGKDFNFFVTLVLLKLVLLHRDNKL